MKKFTLDIFDLLKRIDSSSADIYSSLTIEEQKAFSALVVMRWMSGTNDERQVMALNHFANKVIFPLGKHPQLLMQLLQACSSKVSRRYQWLGIKSSKKKNLSRQVVQDYFDYSSLEMRKLTVLPPPDEIIEMAEALGWQKEEMAKLKKELKE